MSTDVSILLQSCDGFDWDEGNTEKNWIKHKVLWSEVEEVFFNIPLLLQSDAKHSQDEIRYWALGKTNNKRMLFVTFTIRDTKIRIISARDQNKKERSTYEQAA